MHSRSVAVAPSANRSASVPAQLPPAGRDPAAILAELAGYSSDDPAYKEGRLWSLVYYLDESHEQFLHQAYRAYSSANGLNPSAFKSLKRLEGDIIASTLGLLNGPPDACGVVTSGGTESCLLAVKTYRDMARTERGITAPEMIVPPTAHVAWYKAAEYFDVKLRFLQLDASLHADAGQLDRLIGKNTIMVLGSAPEYPHGSIDPIEAMGRITQARQVPLHVDACVGGFILPFMAMNGVALPLWDYRVPGVTSISADLHKYGYAAKGASTITYRRHDILKHQMFVYTEWPGGMFASPALLGTRPGGAYAAAWAALQYFGVAGYRALAADTYAAFTTLRRGIEALPDLCVLGDPSGPLLAYGSTNKAVNIYAVGDRMGAKGWQINRCQNPAGLHAMITAQHLKVVDDYLNDLRESVEAVKANPELAKEGSAATYGMMAHLPLRGMVKRQVLDLFSQSYRQGAEAPSLSPPPPKTAHPGGEPVAHKQPLLERLAAWYIARRHG